MVIGTSGFDDNRQLQAVINAKQHHKQRDPAEGGDLRQGIKQRFYPLRRGRYETKQRPEQRTRRHAQQQPDGQMLEAKPHCASRSPLSSDSAVSATTAGAGKICSGIQRSRRRCTTAADQRRQQPRPAVKPDSRPGEHRF
jgi:hypothetical protein